MKIYKLFTLFYLFILSGFISCSDDDKTVVPKLLKTIYYTQEEECITLEYDNQNRLIRFIETCPEEIITQLTYEDKEVRIEKFGNYYGKFILNEQGYAKSFERANGKSSYFEYSEDGCLINSNNQETSYSYSYSNGNLISCESSKSRTEFTPSENKDILNGPSVYQPIVLYISGNFETRIGYLAGLFGKTNRHLTKKSQYTIQKGEKWEINGTINYLYTFDEDGYVIQVDEDIEGYETLKPTIFTYQNI